MVCVIVQLPRGGRAPLRVGSMYNIIILCLPFLSFHFRRSNGEGIMTDLLSRRSFAPRFLRVSMCVPQKKYKRK